MKKLIAAGKILLIGALAFTLVACSSDSSESKSSVTKEIDVEKSADKVDIEQQSEKKQNTKLDTKEKEELINKFTEELKNTQNRKVMYGEFLDDDNYVYVVTDQLGEQKERIMIVSINDGKVDMRFEGGDLDEDIESIPQIQKLSINRLNNCENPNVCVFRKNENYTKVQMFEINSNDKSINYIGCLRLDNKTEEYTGKYTGDGGYRYVLDSSFPSDYCNE